MTGYLTRRLLHAAATLLVALVLVFLAVRVLPTNPVLARYGQHAAPEKVEAAMAEQGWDRPLWEQLWTFLSAAIGRGDLGESFVSYPGQSVSEILGRALPATIELTAAAIIIAVPMGIAAGVAAAVWRNRAPDALCTTGSLLGVSVPVFFLGILLVSFIPVAPPGFRLSPRVDFASTSGFYLAESLLRGRFDIFADACRHIVLPAAALSSIPMAIIARITRSSMLEVLSADYVRTARAKGIARWRVVLRHALPNAAVPITNIAGFQVGLLLSGAVLTETVFSWPGLGRELVLAVQSSDYAIVQGGALLVAAVFVSINLALDVAYAWLDPRIRRD